MKSPAWSGFLLVTLSTAVPFAIASVALAATVNLGPAKDNTLIETPVGNSNGAGDGFYAGRVGMNGGGTLRRGVLAFDLSSIPANSTVNSVTLTLEMAQAVTSFAATVTLHRLSADWGEAGSTGAGSGAAAQTGDATWMHRFFSTQFWSSAGGDFTAQSSASQTVIDPGSYAWTSSQMVSDVQFWVDNPASNFGWLVKGDETTLQSVKKFDSRSGFVPPVLTVEYQSSVDVPSEDPAGAIALAPPWPIPASGRVNLSYSLPRPLVVSLAIHDVKGRVVRRLMAGASQPAGVHRVAWDGRTESGQPAPTGLYFASLAAGNVFDRRRIPLVR